MKKLIRLPVFILTISFCLIPMALRAQDRASLAGAGGSSVVNNDMSFGGNVPFDEAISPAQTISMELQEANLRDVLKIFSIELSLLKP